MSRFLVRLKLQGFPAAAFGPLVVSEVNKWLDEGIMQVTDAFAGCVTELQSTSEGVATVAVFSGTTVIDPSVSQDQYAEGYQAMRGHLRALAERIARMFAAPAEIEYWMDSQPGELVLGERDMLATSMRQNAA